MQPHLEHGLLVCLVYGSFYSSPSSRHTSEGQGQMGRQELGKRMLAGLWGARGFGKEGVAGLWGLRNRVRGDGGCCPGEGGSHL